MSNSQDKLKLKKILVILGPTASGKTGLALRLAREFNGEIVSADSRQVYKGLDVGSGKDLAEYGEVAYHLIDVVGPNQVFDVAEYKQRAEAAIEEILSRGRLPIVVGGSGLYLQALVDNYQLSDVKPDHQQRQALEQLTLAQVQAKLAEQNKIFFDKLNNSDKNNKRRLIRYLEVLNQEPGAVMVKGQPQYDFLLIGLDWPKEILAERIEKRLKDRLDKEDMVEEVKGLHDQGVAWQRLESFGLEYKFIAQYLQDRLAYEEMFVKLKTAINQFAKRQATWFKRWAKQGAKIIWENDADKVRQLVKDFLK